MDTSTIIQAAVVFIFGAGGIKAFEVYQAWRKGKLERQRECWKQRDEAIVAQREAEQKARILTEEVHRMRTLAFKHGIPSDEIGDWPDD